MQEPATATTEAVGPDTTSESTIRDRVASALSGEQFVAAFRRRTEGSPSNPAVTRERFDALDHLPDEAFDTTPVRTELVVYSETHVYRWVMTAGTVERTRLPRDPSAMAREQ
ncbi:hypothetical protein [Halorientalis regularis]|jgi:hypothetical protein|uniref:Uncharacterized protein n=1 Tax=Halorientalis regularis TaxID=660518 RepID=A0A1G7FN40_9EURY|nr:hypothetical protein [Halorientalis regularis]SDE77367.1 hypothetical protein SAMN05216218_101273 [Halorientalis regularis]